MIDYENVEPAKGGHGGGYKGTSVGGIAEFLLEGHAALRPGALGGQRLGSFARFLIAEGHLCPGF